MNRITKSGLGEDSISDLQRACYRVMLPALATLEVSTWLRETVKRGTCAVVLGESREEYVAREMAQARRNTESIGGLRNFTISLAAVSPEPLLVAVDQEPWGIRRLHGLVPEVGERVLEMSLDDVVRAAGEVGRAAKRLGVSVFLSPVLDVLTGPNPWLEGRTLDTNSHSRVAALASAVVAGTQSEGVATVVKHFPGFPCLENDPALVADVAVPFGHWDAGALEPFQAAVDAGTTGVMLGPAIVEDLDGVEPASTSRIIVNALQERLGFDGLIISDDLDAPATLRGRTLSETGLASLRAGVHLLLVGGGAHVDDLANVVFLEARTDPVLARHVLESARRITVVAQQYGVASHPGMR